MPNNLLASVVTLAWSLAAGSVIGNDFHCGPRAVQAVMQYYGISVELVDIVREIQYPHLAEPVPLDKLQASLDARGIHSRVIRASRNTKVVWDYPVIVHTNVHGEIGHYLAQLPGRGESQLKGTVVYLLTSPAPFEQVAVANAVRPRMRRAEIVLLVAGCILLVALVPSRAQKVAAAFCAASLIGTEMNSLSAQDNQEDNADSFKLVTEAMKAERQSLITGMFEARGTYTREDVPADDHSFTILGAFDYALHSLRFDRSWVDSTGVVRGGQYSRTPEFVALRAAGSERVSIKPPHSEAGAQTTHPFDIRTLGLAYLPDLRANMPLEKMLEFYVAPRKRPREVHQIGNICRIVSVFQGGGVRREDHFDTERGYWPISMREWRRVSVSPLLWDDTPYRENELTLEMRNGLWLPSTYHSRDENVELQLEFTWHAANEVLPPALFSAEGFDLTGAKRVVDFRLGEPIVTRTLETPPQSRWRTWLIVALAVVLIAGAMCAVVLRWQNPKLGGG